jgi:NAD+ synthase
MKHQEIINHIVNWLTSYSDTSKTDGFVVGISGGIDSALTSTLCALTGKKVICLNMPIRQHKTEYDRGNEHIQWLEKKYTNVSSVEVNLTTVFEEMERTYDKNVQDFLTMANTRARLRMTTLYVYAGHHKLLVAGTGNKVEDFGIGFYTKYGDGGVDVSPIADLMKSEVYELAAKAGVIDSILSARPTDGLFADGRTDEDQIGASYDELEWAMLYLENKEHYALNERQKIAMQIFKSRHRANKHKMDPIPVCKIPKDLLK